MPSPPITPLWLIIHRIGLMCIDVEESGARVAVGARVGNAHAQNDKGHACKQKPNGCYEVKIVLFDIILTK